MRPNGYFRHLAVGSWCTYLTHFDPIYFPSPPLLHLSPSSGPSQGFSYMRNPKYEYFKEQNERKMIGNSVTDFVETGEEQRCAFKLSPKIECFIISLIFLWVQKLQHECCLSSKFMIFKRCFKLVSKYITLWLENIALMVRIVARERFHKVFWSNYHRINLLHKSRHKSQSFPKK